MINQSYQSDRLVQRESSSLKNLTSICSPFSSSKFFLILIHVFSESITKVIKFKGKRDIYLLSSIFFSCSSTSPSFSSYPFAKKEVQFFNINNLFQSNHLILSDPSFHKVTILFYSSFFLNPRKVFSYCSYSHYMLFKINCKGIK